MQFYLYVALWYVVNNFYFISILNFWSVLVETFHFQLNPYKKNHSSSMTTMFSRKYLTLLFGEFSAFLYISVSSNFRSTCICQENLDYVIFSKGCLVWLWCLSINVFPWICNQHVSTEILQGINPMVLSAPWADSYLKNIFWTTKLSPQNLVCQTFVSLDFTSVSVNQTFINIFFKKYVLHNYDVYKSMHFC